MGKLYLLRYYALHGAQGDFIMNGVSIVGVVCFFLIGNSLNCYELCILTIPVTAVSQENSATGTQVAKKS